MVVVWSSGFWESIAPGLSSFTAPAIPDLREEFPQQTHWIADYFLNTRFRAHITGNTGVLVATLLRRVDRAFSKYHEARDHTLRFASTFTPNTPDPVSYHRLMYEWEEYVLNLQIASGTFSRLQKGPHFRAGDGSPDDRLWNIANSVKHLGDLKSAEPARDLVIWALHDGLHSVSDFLTFDEAGSLLRQAATLVNDLKDPALFMRQVE